MKLTKDDRSLQATGERTRRHPELPILMLSDNEHSNSWRHGSNISTNSTADPQTFHRWLAEGAPAVRVFGFEGRRP